ncbi:MAG: HAMP domain-containing histidine kinase [Lachnospiraceae bacterium]|nr:HAMP domain-containing histidine kinase [Lachnospiraceae bacterium]
MDRVKRKQKTLGRLFLRYVVIMVVSLVVYSVVIFGIFIFLIDIGQIYPANYPEIMIGKNYQEIKDAKVVTQDMIPDVCRYAIFDADGTVLGGNMDEESMGHAWNAVIHENVMDPYYYKVIVRSHEYVVFQYVLSAQYKSEFLKEHLIEPQTMMTLVIAVGCLLLIIICSLRFGRKMKKMMLPVMDAVDKIRRQDLDYETTFAGVKEIDECLTSIDDLRSELKTSLETQWKAEAEKNRQMSALAHDIKTPLTVVRGNAGLLQETELSGEQKGYADYIAGSAMQIQNYVETLIEVTKSEVGYDVPAKSVDTKSLLGDIKKQVAGLTEVYNLKYEWEESVSAENVNVVYDQLVRAVMNIVKNAAEHTPEGGTVKVAVSDRADKDGKGRLTFVVEDTGSGFSEEALLHGTEQFFMGDSSRTGGTHYGIGLFSAKKAAEKHGGTIALANGENGGGKVSIGF